MKKYQSMEERFLQTRYTALLISIQNNSEVFACRVPKTYGDHIQILLLSKDQVFIDSDLEKNIILHLFLKTNPVK